MIYVVLKVVFHEVFSQLLSVAETLESTVHVAGVAEVLESDHASPSPVVFLLQSKLLESNRFPPQMLLLQLTLCLMTFPVLLQAFHTAVFDSFALAAIQFSSFPTFLVATFITTAALLLPLPCQDIQVPFPNCVNIFKTVPVSHYLAVLVVATDLALAPNRGQFVPQSVPILFLGYLHKDKVLGSRAGFVGSGDEDAFEVDFCEYFLGFVDEGDIESFEIDSSIPLFEKEPTLLREQLVGCSGKDVVIGVLLVRTGIKKYIVDMIDQLKLNNRSRMASLSLDLLP